MYINVSIYTYIYKCIDNAYTYHIYIYDNMYIYI